jgi:hypothetical protein
MSDISENQLSLNIEVEELSEFEKVKRMKFSSPHQFMINEKVKIVSYNPLSTSNSYNNLINTVLIAYNRVNHTWKLPINHNDSVCCEISSNGSSLYVNPKDLDLVIEDEQDYIAIKKARFEIWDRQLAYLEKEAVILREKALKAYEQIFKAIDEVFKDQWDFYIDKTNQHLNVIILFPEVKISNSLEQKHIIKDLYIRLEFKPDLKLNEMYGCRGVVNNQEYQVKYWHSHLYKGDYFYKWNTWCRGESELAQIYQLNKSTYNIGNLHRFLYQIPEYICWESREGGPYIRIEYIGANNNQPPSIINQSEIDKIYKKLISTTDVFPVKLNVGVKNTLIIEKREVIEELIIPHAKGFTCIKKGDNYILENNNSSVEANLKSWNNSLKDVVMFKFKGQDIKPQIVLTDAKLEGKLTPYPALTTNIINELTNNINKYALQYE